jgi:putative hemolysin
MAARPTAEMAAVQRDFDHFDAHCHHLLVIDHSRGKGERAVVGTYRLIRRETAEICGKFYSSDEYDIAPLVDYPGPLLELGRSCVDAEYRNRSTMQLLWRGIAAYLFHYEIVLMFGCASLPGIDPETLALPLSYLYYHHLAPPALRARALPHRYVDMRLLEQSSIDPRQAIAVMPPLVKGYLRIGAFVGDGAVIDHQFNTTDVCIIYKTDLVPDRYLRPYDRHSRNASGL